MFSSNGNCCGNLEILCPCPTKDLEHMVDFLYYGKIPYEEGIEKSNILDTHELTTTTKSASSRTIVRFGTSTSATLKTSMTSTTSTSSTTKNSSTTTQGNIYCLNFLSHLSSYQTFLN